MKRKVWGSFFLALLVIVAGGYWWRYHGGELSPGDESAAANTESPQEVVAPVRVTPIKKGTVTEEISVYGTIVPAAGAVQTVSVPFESRVRRILVTEAQKVSRGDPLLEIEPSPDAELQAEQARSDYRSAKKALAYMQQRFNLKLGTNDQLLQAKQALGQAQAKLESLRRRGINGMRTIRADVAGLISKVSTQEGAIVPAGKSMIEMIAQNRLEVRLGVEPEDIDKVKVGQPVSLARVNIAASKVFAGRLSKISRAASPTSRLVELFVTLPPSSRLLLGEYILGRITVGSAQGLIVPRSAVLPQGDHYVLFTVKDGRAQEHRVRVGLQTEKKIQVSADSLHAGDLVVTLGNYELKQGMAVKTEKS
jgi:membrane fusion protein (multidrug efflux system)